jgi:hypothetical protein
MGMRFEMLPEIDNQINLLAYPVDIMGGSHMVCPPIPSLAVYAFQSQIRAKITWWISPLEKNSEDFL